MVAGSICVSATCPTTFRESLNIPGPRLTPRKKDHAAMKRFIAATLAIAALLPAAQVLAQPPAVNYALPGAANPGQPTDITFHGGNLAGPSGFWSSLPGAKIELAPGIEGNGTKADQVVYRFTVPAETPVGVYAFRLATGKGVSSARLLMVDDLPSVADNGANKTIETAQPLPFPIAVDGACEAESFDYYKLNVVAGQRVSVEVVARRLGSPLDAVIRLLDASGRELAYSDDEAGLGSDGRFAHRFAEAGDYFLEIRDIRYQGGGNHRYRIRVGDFPLVSTPYPMAGQKGSTPKLLALGPDASGVAPINTAVPANAAADSRVPVGQIPQRPRLGGADVDRLRPDGTG